MKLTPTLTLAMTLAAGIAGVAAAQTATTATPMPNTPAPAAAAAPPQTNAAPAQPGSTQVSPSGGQIHQPQAQPMAAATPMPSGTDQQVREAQQRLQAAGLYNGPVDGLMDPDTRAALARYQQQNGLRRTETLDQATLTHLNSQPVGSGSTTPGAAMPAPSGNPMPAPTQASGGNTGKSTAR